MAEEVKGTGTEGQQGTEGTQNQQIQQSAKQQTTETQKQETEQKVDVEKVKSEALSGFLKDLGVEDADALKGIVTKHNETEEANKTELQKKEDALTETTKELAREREGRILAEAKLSAVQLGAKPELVDDLVVVAKAKVTNGKDINAVIAEIKDSTSGRVYFKSDEEEEEEGKNKTKGKTVTRARVTKPSEKSKGKEEEEGKKEEHKGSMAERLLEGRKEKKSHYFK
ncbi:hypothetical protein CS266P3_00008 [Clostridium phage CS266P3]|nr:hypothetical protein CS266P3_00008 [Clostridium phage CS266P3]